MYQQRLQYARRVVGSAIPFWFGTVNHKPVRFSFGHDCYPRPRNHPRIGRRHWRKRKYSGAVGTYHARSIENVGGLDLLYFPVNARTLIAQGYVVQSVRRGLLNQRPRARYLGNQLKVTNTVQQQQQRQQRREGR